MSCSSIVPTDGALPETVYPFVIQVHGAWVPRAGARTSCIYFDITDERGDGCAHFKFVSCDGRTYLVLAYAPRLGKSTYVRPQVSRGCVGGELA